MQVVGKVICDFKQADIQKDRHMYGKADRQTDTLVDRQIDRQKDLQTERLKVRQRETNK